MTQGIYCYIDKKTNEIVYIGKDSYIDKKTRHRAHKKPSAYNAQHFNKVLQNNLNRYKYKVLEEGNISQDFLNALEMCFIQKYNPIFNFTRGGDGCLGFRLSNESKKKMSESRKGNSNALGMKHSEETKKKISERMKGKNNPMYGKTHPMFGRNRSEETRIKISKKLNTSGYYRVSKQKLSRLKQGFCWKYQWLGEDKKQKAIWSTNIKELEKKVKEKGLPWFKLDEV